MCAWCPCKSGEGVTASRGEVTGGRRVISSLVGAGNWAQGSLQEQPVLLRAEPSLRPSVWPLPIVSHFSLSFHSYLLCAIQPQWARMLSPLSPFVPVTRVSGCLQVCPNFSVTRVVHSFPQPPPWWGEVWVLSWRGGSVFFSSFWKCLYSSTCNSFICLVKLTLHSFNSFYCYCTFIVLLIFISNHSLVHKCNQHLYIDFMSCQLCWIY